MYKKAIICVDDEPIILFSLKQELVSYFGARFLYETANDAATALHIIDELTKRDVRVVVVISDWLMPGMKGDEFIIKVRSLYPDIRCIILSGQATAEAIENCQKNANLAAYIEKPYQMETLMRAIDTAVGIEGG